MPFSKNYQKTTTFLKNTAVRQQTHLVCSCPEVCFDCLTLSFRVSEPETGAGDSWGCSNTQSLASSKLMVCGWGGVEGTEPQEGAGTV